LLERAVLSRHPSDVTEFKVLWVHYVLWCRATGKRWANKKRVREQLHALNVPREDPVEGSKHEFYLLQLLETPLGQKTVKRAVSKGPTVKGYVRVERELQFYGASNVPVGTRLSWLWPTEAERERLAAQTGRGPGSSVATQIVVEWEGRRRYVPSQDVEMLSD
jgi:hypothetical protein